MSESTSESIEERIAHAQAHLENMKAAVARAEQDLRTTSATGRSSDRSVEVTIGPQGELTGLTFLDNKFRGMTGPQLAAAVLEASRQGRQKVAERVMDTFRPLTAANPNAPGSRGLEVDWERIFGAAFEGDQRTGRGRSSSDRLRDEIDEDTDIPGGRS